MKDKLQEQLRETLSGCSIPSERISSYYNILSFIDQNFIGKEEVREKINSRMILQLCEHDFDDEDEEDEVARKRQNKLLEDLLELMNIIN